MSELRWLNITTKNGDGGRGRGAGDMGREAAVVLTVEGCGWRGN